MRQIKSFKNKLFLSYLFIIIIPFTLLAFLLDKNLEENSLHDIKNSLINQGLVIENQLTAEQIRQEDITQLEKLVKTLSPLSKSRITVISKDGRVLADSEKSQQEALQMENHAGRPEVQEALSGYIGKEIRYSATLKIDMLYIALPIKDAGGVFGVLRLALPLESVRMTLLAIRKAITFSVIFAVLMSFVLGSILSRGIIKPVNRIIHISRQFSKGDFSHRIFQDSQDEIGQLAATLNGMAQDLEDKIKKIEIQNQQLRTILESMIEGIVVVDKLGHIITVNSTIERIFGVSRGECEGKILLEVIRNDGINGIMAEVLKGARPILRETSLVWPMHKIFQVNASPIFEREAVNGCVFVIHDITEIRRLEQVRSDFVANVSHELKTPLTSIKGFVETLIEGALEDKEHSRDFLKVIEEHTNRLDNLVNDLLDLSYLESTQAKLKKDNVYLKKMVDGILSGFASQLKKKGVEADNNLSAGLSVLADKDKIEQVFTNLIDNAIKFNKDGGSLDIDSEDLTDKIKITVEDFGIGIPVKDIPRIFERFYRVDKARSRTLGGTGLGLSIVKHIVELHGGTVGVESTEGLGSTFWFALPKQ